MDRKHMLMSEYIDDNILNRGNLGPGEQPRYLTAGLGLPKICPRLTLLTPIPKYVSLSVFPTDLKQYQRTNERNQFNMPVMFIGNKGTKTIPPPSNFPLPWKQTFDDEDVSAPPKIWYDQVGGDEGKKNRATLAVACLPIRSPSLAVARVLYCCC